MKRIYFIVCPTIENHQGTEIGHSGPFGQKRKTCPHCRETVRKNNLKGHQLIEDFKL